MTEPIVDLLETEWAALAELACDFTDSDWATPTELPGWTVQDCYAHVAGSERALQGEAPPEVDLSGLTHLSAPSALFTEPPVQARRHLSGAEVLAELEAVAGERVAALRELSPDEWEAEGPTPVGHASYREFMNVRTFDCWMHEQDVRRALGRPGHQEGPVAEHSLGRCMRALGFIVGKKAAAPDGSSVVFVLSGPMARSVAVGVDAGRASVLDAVPESPTTVLRMATETLWCLLGGRWHPDQVRSDDLVHIEGDDALGRAVVQAANIMV